MPSTILVTEDNLTLRWLFVQQLEKLGFECDCAADGQEAIDRFKKHRAYELVLMDVMMPEVDGYEATRAIREFERRQQLKRTPIVAVTCVDDPTACVKAGMDDFWHKPILPQHMQQILEKWLPEKRLRLLRRFDKERGPVREAERPA